MYQRCESRVICRKTLTSRNAWKKNGNKNFPRLISSPGNHPPLAPTFARFRTDPKDSNNIFAEDEMKRLSAFGSILVSRNWLLWNLFRVLPRGKWWSGFSFFIILLGSSSYRRILAWNRYHGIKWLIFRCIKRSSVCSFEILLYGILHSMFFLMFRTSQS